jgi:hypothetical protein
LPTLDEVLRDIVPPPYNLEAFTTYLSQSHCLETIDFINETERYREDYTFLVDREQGSTLTTSSLAIEHLLMLYRLLLTSYIQPGAPCEINISVEMRDALLRHKDSAIPPHPDILDPALKTMHELMEHSIFVSFLNNRSNFLSPSEDANRSDTRLHLLALSASDSSPKPRSLPAKRPSIGFFGRALTWPIEPNFTRRMQVKHGHRPEK